MRSGLVRKRPSGAFVVNNEYSIIWLNSWKRAIETLVKAQSHGWFCFKWIVCLLPWKPNGLTKKKKKEGEEIKTKTERETPHCKQGMWRAGIHFPLKKVFSIELNKCRPFLLWLSHPLENNPKSECFKTFMFLFSWLCLITVCCLLLHALLSRMCNLGLHITQAYRSLLAATRTPLSPPQLSHLF